MKKHIEFKTSGTCSRMVIVDIEDNIITDCKFVGGCAGNTQGVAALVKGMTTDEAIAKINAVTREEIITVAQKIRFDSVYFLCGAGEEEEEFDE